MLRDVDTSLMTWLAGFLPSASEVAFDLPAERPDGGQVLALHLHDVREEGELTPGDWSGLRNPEGYTVARLPPQRRYRLTYLVMAWAATTLDEHELLGTVLAGCATQHTLPAEALQGSLAGTGQAIMVRCAPLERSCDPRELWAAWRMAPRTALELTVLAALPVALLTNLPKAPEAIDLSSTRPPNGSRRFGPGRPDHHGNGAVPRARRGITE